MKLRPKPPGKDISNQQNDLIAHGKSIRKKTEQGWLQSQKVTSLFFKFWKDTLQKNINTSNQHHFEQLSHQIDNFVSSECLDIFETFSHARQIKFCELVVNSPYVSVETLMAQFTGAKPKGKITVAPLLSLASQLF